MLDRYEECPSFHLAKKKKIYKLSEKDEKNLDIVFINLIILFFIIAVILYVVHLLVFSGCSIKQEKNQGNEQKNSINKNQPKTENQAKILNGEVLKFAGKGFKLNFTAPINNGLAMYYSPDEENVGLKSQLIINQYGKEIKGKDLANGIIKESEARGAKLFSPFVAPDNKKRGAHYIASREIDEYDETLATNYLMKIFEDGGSTYSIIYSQNIKGKDKKDLLNISEQWFIDNLMQYNGAIEGIDLSSNISFYDRNKEILKSLSKSNKYQFLKWDNKVITEENNYAAVSMEYPRFIGGAEVSGLNELIKGVVDKFLSEDRSDVKGWLDKGAEGCSKNLKEYEYECSVNLVISYEVGSIINDIVSIKMIITDYTGGGNGNHDQVVVINYDFKNDQYLKPSSLFCSKDYISKLAPLVKDDMYSQIGDYSDKETEDSAAVDSDNYQNIGLGEFGIKIYFQPYSVASGTFGIFESFIPYSDLVGDICLP